MGTARGQCYPGGDGTQEMVVPVARWYPRDGDSQGTVLPRGWGYPEDRVPRGWNLSLHSRAGGAERQPGCWWVSFTHSPVVPVAPLVPMVPWSLCCIWFPQPCGPPGPTVPMTLLVPAVPRAPQPHGWWQLGRQRGRGKSRGGRTPSPAPACTVHFILSKHGVSAAAPPQRRLPAIRPGLSLSPPACWARPPQHSAVSPDPPSCCPPAPSISGGN